MLSSRTLRFLPLLALLPVAACNCHEKPVNPLDVCGSVEGVQEDFLEACTDNNQCADHFACTAVKDREGLQCCVFADRKCNTEADCCPGQTCPAERKKCFDKFLECETDADCGDRGDRVCETWTDSYGTSSRCRFKACSDLGACPEGQSCFKGECMADLPCGGSCEPGKACVPSIDRCQDYACPVSCSPGHIATFNDNRNIWDTCKLPDVACECAELPPLRSGDLGRFSALSPEPSQSAVFVSQYDGEFGDLVVNKYEANGQLARQEYVDGVPAGATVKYGPSGARGGVIEPGPDVGRYTDIATNNGLVYVSYYDVTNGDLNVATRDANGTWTTSSIDGTDADLGLYTSIGVDSDGYPTISYFQRGGLESFDPAPCPNPDPTGDKRFITALKVARATSPTPGAGDWAITTVACQSRPAPACFGCMNTCADPGTGPGCYVADTTCSGCDANTETCVMVGNQPTCAKNYNPSTLNEIIDGVGLFSALAMDGKDAVVTYMRRTDGKGQLEGVRVSGSGMATAPVVLDASGDTGYFPDVKIDPTTNNLAIAYHDFTSRKLKFLYNQNLVAGLTPEVIDNGAGMTGAGETNWVGTDVALAFSSTGSLFVAYQDATNGDLKLASRTAMWELLQSPRTEGAVGFFADSAFLGNTLFMSHARIRAKLVGGEPKVDNSLLLETFSAP